MKTILLFIFYFGFSILASAQDDNMAEILFLQANDAVAKQDYDKAIQRYKQLIAGENQSSNIHFNLGNVYFQTEEYGKAALHYEKAFALNPNDRDIQVNLLLSQKAAGIDLRQPGVIENFKYFISVDKWFLITCLSFWLIAFILIINRFHKVRSILIKMTLGPLLLIFTISLVALAMLHDESSRAIITQDNSRVHIAPASSSEVTLNLSQTEEVSIIKEHNDYFLVENKQGSRGWIQKNNVGKIWD